MERNSRKDQTGTFLALIAILLIGGAFRFYNLNWDKGTYHIHPDERHTTMVITAIQWPRSLGEYFDTSRSPLNPRNNNMVFFYGTFPLFFTKFVATQLDKGVNLYDGRYGGLGGASPGLSLTSYDQIHLVGRALSALFDLGSVLLIFFLGRRLFDWRVGLFASFLLALAVLNIQGSHYFAVDTFLTFFVGLTLWFTLDQVEGKGWLSFGALGISMGLTLACKVSVFLLVVVIALGAWLRIRRQVGDGQRPGHAVLKATLGLILAAFLAIAVFRVAQPYAWAGPNYQGWDSVPEPWAERFRIFQHVPEPIRAVIMPNPQWIADIVSAGAQQTGEADMPWGRQWTERTPWLYPIENMVFWGLGVPLGTAAWLGVFLAAVRLAHVWRSSRSRGAEYGNGCWEGVLIPLAWVVLTFFWQGMQFVKSIRYFLPIYPALAMFAAYLVVFVWDWTRKRHWVFRVLGGTFGALVLLGTLAWAWAFIQIYREPVTRVQATRWMYENIETGATLRYRTLDGRPGQWQLDLPSIHVYETNGGWLVTPFTPAQDLTVTEVVMNHLTALDGPRHGVIEVQITLADLQEEPLAQGQLEATFGETGEKQYVLDLPDLYLTEGQLYLVRIRAVQGAPLVSKGAAIANEHFDDPLPFNMDGRVAFGTGPYRGLDLTLYDEDTPEKLEKLLDVLDEADYIVMSSGRLYNSIPRLPMRYPVTTRYYQLLFAEKLGFEKAVEFHSYPRLFGFEFNDDRAEEQFTVYDHPKVLIYRKTDDYDRERVRALLSEGINWDEIAHWLNPRDVPRWKRTHQHRNELMLTEEQKRIQRQGGTWALIFNWNSLVNRWPTLSWIILIEALGLLTLPLTVAVLGQLPDQGYILSKPIGVLLLAWMSWILTNLTALQYTRGTIFLALGVIALGSLGFLLFPGPRRRLSNMWRGQKRLILANEFFFFVFWALFWLIRWGNPDLWHPWMGGEKPMDFAYLNAVIKSLEFPPYDPWFAGGYLNYYYFGQVMVGTLIKLIGIVPATAYNLVIPTWFAMTAMGAFSVTYNLVARRHEEEQEHGRPGFLRSLFFGLVGALFTSVLGNLDQVRLIVSAVSEGVLDRFHSTIPGLAGLVRLVVGLFQIIFQGKPLPIALNEWYWNASRAIPSPPTEPVITEFPFFTFLYADLHAHLIALPLTFISLSIALAVVKEAEETQEAAEAMWRRLSRLLVILFLWSVTIGAMRTTNTWDVPPHLLIVLGALTIVEIGRRGLNLRSIATVAWQFGLVFVLGWALLYRPFWVYYGAFYNSVTLWSGTRTVLWAYLLVHGLFLFAIVSYLWATVIDGKQGDSLLRRLRLTVRYWTRRDRLQEVAHAMGVEGVPVGARFWTGLVVFLLLEIFFLTPGLIPFTRAKEELIAAGEYAYRGLVVFALGLPVAIGGLLLLFRRGLSATRRFWAYLVLLGLAMTLGVEVVVLVGDVGRMNTVFKFYLQVWLIWGVAAAAALAWIAPYVGRWQQGQGLWLGVLAVLLFSAMLYPPLAASAKIRDRFDPRLGPGLDGWAYMTTARYSDPNGHEYELKWDLEGIRWMLDNVVGSPVILEGHTPEYRWGGRYSINTGLPAVLGWNWHQRQQRAAGNEQEVWKRAEDVAQIYNTPVPDVAESLLRQYEVEYVVVGPLEETYYEPAGLDKFERMVRQGELQVVFRNEEVTIYRVVR
ncbi:MAG: DUF2298 domain-containing protein [Anaerolineae bacterium]